MQRFGSCARATWLRKVGRWLEEREIEHAEISLFFLNEKKED